MVFRGRPSAGCEQCRRDKKRCTLERPTCARCVRLCRPCEGYRDSTQLRIQDESRKFDAEAKNTSSSDGSRHLRVPDPPSAARLDQGNGAQSRLNFGHDLLGVRPGQDAFDVSIQYFFSCFRERVHWMHLEKLISPSHTNHALRHAIQACGMAALNSRHPFENGATRARHQYWTAMVRLQDDLRDPAQSLTEVSLNAVTILGYFEMLVTDDQSTTTSWAMHVRGACHMLALRGTRQFDTISGRGLFRELRIQSLICSLLDHTKPQSFLLKEQDSLLRLTSEEEHGHVADRLVEICFQISDLQIRILRQSIPCAVALEESSRLDEKLLEWSMRTFAEEELYHWRKIQVDDSPHVWDRTAHVFPVPQGTVATLPDGIWQLYRTMRILLCQARETLLPQAEMTREAKSSNHRRLCAIQLEMANDICAAVPSALGHIDSIPQAQPCFVSFYGQVWPLFMAARACFVIQRSPWQDEVTPGNSARLKDQLAWIQRRLIYISNEMGFRWVGPLVATLCKDIDIENYRLSV